MSRIEKLNQAFKKEIGQIIQNELKDPRLGFITVTRVEIVKDLKQATVYFSVLGDEDKINSAQEGLNSAAGFIRKLLGQRIKIRYNPELIFKFDRSTEYSFHILEQLERIKNESKKNR